MVTVVNSDILRACGQPSKKSQKSGGKGSVPSLEETFQFGCVSQTILREV